VEEDMLTILAILYGLGSLLLIIIVMLQAGKGAGMGLFGGGSSSTTFGVQGGNVLTRITTILGVAFFGIAMIIAFMVSRDTTISGSEFNKPVKTGKARIFAPGTDTKKTNKKASKAGASDKLSKPAITVKTNTK